MIPVTKELISQIVFYEKDKEVNFDYNLPDNPEQLTHKMLGQIYKIFLNQNSNSVNIDLFDLGTILKCTGNALLGFEKAKGPDGALDAISKALKRDESQLSQTAKCQMALLFIVSGKDAELEMDELTEITEYMQENLWEKTEVIFGHSESDELDRGIQVMVVVSASLT